MNSAVIHSFTDFQELHQSNHGMAGNHEAGGFVNSTVYSTVNGNYRLSSVPSL